MKCVCVREMWDNIFFNYTIVILLCVEWKKKETWFNQSLHSISKRIERYFSRITRGITYVCKRFHRFFFQALDSCVALLFHKQSSINCTHRLLSMPNLSRNSSIARNFKGLFNQKTCSTWEYLVFLVTSRHNISDGLLWCVGSSTRAQSVVSMATNFHAKPYVMYVRLRIIEIVRSFVRANKIIQVTLATFFVSLLKIGERYACAVKMLKAANNFSNSFYLIKSLNFSPFSHKQSRKADKFVIISAPDCLFTFTSVGTSH